MPSVGIAPGLFPTAAPRALCDGVPTAHHSCLQQATRMKAKDACEMPTIAAEEHLTSSEANTCFEVYPPLIDRRGSKREAHCPPTTPRISGFKVVAKLA